MKVTVLTMLPKIKITFLVIYEELMIINESRGKTVLKVDTIPEKTLEIHLVRENENFCEKFPVISLKGIWLKYTLLNVPLLP